MNVAPLDIAVAVLPIVLGIIAGVLNLTTDKEKTGRKKLTVAGVFFVLLSIFYLIIATISLSVTSAKNTKELKDSKVEVQNLRHGIDSFKIESQAYYKIITDKIDTSSLQWKLFVKSLYDSSLNYERQLFSIQTDINFCPSDSNFNLYEFGKYGYKVPIQICNNSISVHNFRIEVYLLQKFLKSYTVIFNDNNFLNAELLQNGDILRNYLNFPFEIYGDSIFVYFKGSYFDNKRNRTFQKLYLKPPNVKSLMPADENKNKKVIIDLKSLNIW